ncbi:hypothetical protein V6Z05_15515 [Leptospira venezuelensis]|uniref:hypothetical protein n=1 Tax=Leptospira venezuelensis TaxID=1958811 RepID=UPI000A3619C4|nr:hypothetical protein [Leptospira venezuelensis]
MNLFAHNQSLYSKGFAWPFIFFTLLIVACSPKPKETNENAELNKPLSRKLERTILSSSKKYELKIYSSENPGCSDQPSSAYDGDTIKRAMLCEFQIVDTVDKKVKYEISLSEDKKSIQDSQKCKPDGFVLELAYDFIQWDENDHIVYWGNIRNYGAADSSDSIYSFDWKNCKTDLVFSISSEHCTDACDSISYVYYNSQNYVFIYDQKSSDVQIRKMLPGGKKKNGFFKDSPKSDAELFQIDPKKSSELARFVVTGIASFSSEFPNIIIHTRDSKITFSLDSESMISTEVKK